MAVEIAHASQSHYGDVAAIGLADAPVDAPMSSTVTDHRGGFSVQFSVKITPNAC